MNQIQTDIKNVFIKNMNFLKTFPLKKELKKTEVNNIQ